MSLRTPPISIECFIAPLVVFSAAVQRAVLSQSAFQDGILPQNDGKSI
jgi:hypothetical protein